MLFIVYLMLLMLIISLVKTAISGRVVSSQIFTSGRQYAIQDHQFWTNNATFYTIALVLMIEASIWAGELPKVNYRQRIFIIHMISNAVYIIGLTTAKFKITGLTNPYIHRIVARVTLIASLSTISTGVTMLSSN